MAGLLMLSSRNSRELCKIIKKANTLDLTKVLIFYI